MNISVLTNKLCAIYENAGFLKYKMQKFEEYSLYLQNKSFLQSEFVITFNDLSGRLLALKPDVTLSILKNSKAGSGKTEKVYYTESVYRLDRKSHEYREINQAGLEVIGSVSETETAEVIILALKSLEASGQNFTLDIAHMGLYRSLTASLPATLSEKVTECFKAKNIHELRLLLEGYEEKDKIISLAELKGSTAQRLSLLEKIFPDNEVLEELKGVYSVLEELGYADKIGIDFSIIEGSVYYNGIVFKGYLENLYKATLSGGRYDKLSDGFKKGLEALGFAVYLDDLSSLSETEEFDCDTLVVGENSLAVLKVAEALRLSGERIRTARENNGSIRYKQVLEVE